MALITIRDIQKLKDIEKELSSLTTTSEDQIPDKSKIEGLIQSLKKKIIMSNEVLQHIIVLWKYDCRGIWNM